MTILDKVLVHKQREIERLHDKEKAGELPEITAYLKGKMVEAPHSFKKAMEEKSFNVIAEIKRCSPSRGEIAEIENPEKLAKQYELGGASALSILTDRKYFGGSIEDIRKVKQVVNIPILRKDFIMDKIQIAEAASEGASCILLIVKALKEETKELFDFATSIGMDVLVEIHSTVELELAIDIKTEIIGVNNRNLETFHTDLEASLKLAPIIPNHMIRIAESAIFNEDDIKRVKEAGYNGALIGQALVESENPKDLIRNFLKAAEDE
ncbi:MAG: Indole-3-glycerol phosphate synthase [Chlamydiia bacterium]|nr:Indole-3-glycerol phosphate synthase [Chlamydiia bacterium]